MQIIKKGILPFSIYVVGLTFLFLPEIPAMGEKPNVPMVSPEQLQSMMANPEVIVIDVREPVSWSKSQTKIRGAVREDPTKEIPEWAKKYPKEKTLVFYCA